MIKKINEKEQNCIFLKKIKIKSRLKKLENQLNIFEQK